MAGTRGDLRRQEPRPTSYERIVRAAYKCFERNGIDRTSIEEIAREAGVTRPTVYRYFPSKIHIVDLISTEESRKVNAEVRRRLVRGLGFEETITEALVLVLRIAVENPYLRRIVASREFEAEVTSSSSDMHRLHREWWGRLLSHAAEEGVLATDITEEEILVWLTLSQHMLLTRLEAGPMSDEALRRMIRRFVVDPLLAARGR